MQIHHDAQGTYVDPSELGGVHNFDSNGTRLLNILTYFNNTISQRYAAKYGEDFDMTQCDFFQKCGEALSRGTELRNTWTSAELSDRIRLYEKISGLFTAAGEQEREDCSYVVRVAKFLRDNA